ncbi:MAG: PASTA domain-containing protein [Endomicrobium sp.]|nr:PASTA domain-containing protein [Endomicrobium sp.]
MAKSLKIFIVLVMISFAFYFAFNMIMISLVHSKKEISTPSIVGKNLYNAIDEISKYGFGLRVDGKEISQIVPAGTILRQNPPAGMYVREGKVIKVTVSCGGQIIYVPNLIGQSIRSADISLRAATLVMGEVTKRYSEVADKDTVVAQDIAPGTKIDKDSVVNLIVSDGQPPERMIIMPDFINKNFQEAIEWSLQMGIVLNIAKEKSAEFDSDIIIRQYPEADRDITNLQSISVTVTERV